MGAQEIVQLICRVCEIPSGGMVWIFDFYVYVLDTSKFTEMF